MSTVGVERHWFTPQPDGLTGGSSLRMEWDREFENNAAVDAISD